MYRSEIRINDPDRKLLKKRLLIPLAVVLFIVVGVGAYWLFARDDTADKDNNTQTQEPASQSDLSPDVETGNPPYVAPDLQPTIDQWLAGQSATYSIVVHDTNAQKNIATNLPDKEYFAASLYKLFVAYLALLDFQNGVQNPEEILTQGFTRKQCVDKMIRESHSPCGEAMMADMGPAQLESRLEAMGINNTSFASITTTAQDTAKLLTYITRKRHLNDANTEFLLDAMQDQPNTYERGLKRGTPKATWQTKVGWNQDINYHDVGIMILPDKRQFVVAILSQGQGSSNPIADFASTVYTALTQ